MDPSVEALNYRHETSTKIKLKFDHATIQIAEQLRSEKSPTTEEPEPLKQVTPIKETNGTTESLLVSEMPPLENDPFYMNRVINLNLDILDTRDRLSYNRLRDGGSRPNLPGNQFIASHQLPLFLKTVDGNLFYDSNDKFEPQVASLAMFVNMNIKNEHMALGGDKGGIHAFAPRRRRRGTGKSTKKY